MSVESAHFLTFPGEPSLHRRGATTPAAPPLGFRQSLRQLADLSTRFAHVVLDWPIAFWVILDGSLAVLAMRLAHWLSPSYRGALAEHRTLYSLWLVCAIYGLAVPLSSYGASLYDRLNLKTVPRVIGRCAGANLLAIVLLTVSFQWVLYTPIGRLVLVLAFLQGSVAMAVPRLLAFALASHRKHRVLFVGTSARFRAFRDELDGSFGRFYESPRELLVDSQAAAVAVSSSGARSNMGGTPMPLRTADAVLAACAARQIDELVVEEDCAVIDDVLSVATILVGNGCTIRTYSAFCEQMFGHFPVDSIDHRSLLGQGWGVGRQTTELTKRLMDLTLAAVLLAGCLPMMAIIALLVKLSGPGAVIYRQTRVGRFGRPFTIYKFRSMTADAETGTPIWADVNDARVTRVGKFLRLFRLDELPQLWNVLLGQMSMVGPRPERPEFVAELSRQIPFYPMRHLVPPGITGWAQIRYSYAASAEDAKRKLCYDLYYIRQYGLWLDLSICLRTLGVIAKGSR